MADFELPKRGPGRHPMRVEESAPPKPALPKKIRVAAHHGFIDENGRHQMWPEGVIITNDYEIGLLLGRGAPVEILD